MVIDFLQHDALAVADLIRRKEISPRDAVQASINRVVAHTWCANASFICEPAIARP